MLLFAALFVHRVEAGSYPGINRVAIVICENEALASTLAAAPWPTFVPLGTFFTGYNAITHPSYPNYLTIVSGTDWGFIDDNQRTIKNTSIVDLLEDAGVSWGVYATGYPGNCYLGDSGKYARKHSPLLSFRKVQYKRELCALNYPGTQWMTDLAAGNMSRFVMYIPDLNEDGHDTNLATSGAFVQAFIANVTAHPAWWNETLLIVTFDEGTPGVGGTSTNNNIFTMFMGGHIKVNTNVSTTYNHYSLLRTIEDVLGLGQLGRNDSLATIMTGFFKP